jgi:uncharacterized protein YgiM (DUF1202 family)
MIRALAILIFISCSVIATRADFESANRLYEKGDYANAATAYEQIVRSGESSPALYFNLGNAYFKNNQTGRAIAAYAQAEALSPRDPDIRANLKFALDAVPGNNTRPTAIDRALQLLTLNERGIATAIAVWICFGSLALAQLRPDLKNGLHTLVVASGIFAVAFGAWYAQGLIERATNRKIVVVAPTAVVRFGPLEESQVSFNVRDGFVLQLIGKKDKWIQVADASNRSGWILEDETLRLP